MPAFKPRAALLVLNHPFGAIEGPARLIAEGLVARGWDASVINVNDKEHRVEAIYRLITEPCDLVLSLTPLPLTTMVLGKELAQHLHCPIAILFVDSPIYLPTAELALIGRLPEQSLLLFVDASHCKHMRRSLKSHGIDGLEVAFFPFGAPNHTSNNSCVSVPNTDHVDRPFDLTIFATLDHQIHTGFATGDRFTGAFPSLESSRFEAQHADIEELAQSMLHNDYGVDIVALLSDRFCLGSVHQDPEELMLMQVFDSYLKRYRRYNLTQSLIEGARHGELRVALYGTGWQHMHDMPPSWSVFGPVPYMQQFESFAMSRYVLNLDPNWSHGIHDRVFNAISVGSTPLTNHNALTDILFDDGHDSLIFKSSQEALPRLMETIDDSQSLAVQANISVQLGLAGWVDRCAVFDRFIHLGSAN